MSVLLEARPYRPFKSSEEYLIAMKEDLAEWLNALYPELRMSLDNFMDRLDTGVALCKHANSVRKSAADYVARRQARKIMTRSITSSLAVPMSQLSDVAFLPNAKAGTFFARDNVSNFISWCRNSLGIIECLLFETDDLIMRKNERHVILCLLEVARRGAKFGMLAPMLVQMERQIDREIAADNKANGAGSNTPGGRSNGHHAHEDEEDADDEDEYADVNQREPCLIYGPQPQIVTNDLKSLDEMVRELVERCTCPTQFPMIRVSEGKYRIGDTKVLIFVRILRSHVMVRVGGGWDTLSHYLDKHDPCRCRTSHRSMISAKLIQKAGGSFDLGSAQVHYERSPPRTRRSSASSVGSCAGTPPQQQQSPSHQLQTPRSASALGNRSRSPTPHQTHRQLGQELKKMENRSPSPTAESTRKSPSSSPSDLSGNVVVHQRRSRSPTPNASASLVHQRGRADDYREPRNEVVVVVEPREPREPRGEVNLSEEFTKRYVVEGGVARRTTERDHAATKYEATIYDYKCADCPAETSGNSSPISSPTIIDKDEQPQSRKSSNDNEDSFARESPRRNDVKCSQTEGEHSDNGSEVSDEGYRSLGAVQSSVTTTTHHHHHHHHHQNHQEPPPVDTANKGRDTAADETRKNESPEDVRCCVETESIETGLRKTGAGGGGTSSPSKSGQSPGSATTRSSGAGSNGSNNAPNVERQSRVANNTTMARENSNVSRCSSGSGTPREGNSSPEGGSSPLKRAASGRKSSRKPPAPPISSPGRASGCCRITGNNNANAQNSTSNTWNGRQSKQRPSLTNDTFLKPANPARPANQPVKSSSPTNFSRRNPSRRSLPRLSGCAAAAAAAAAATATAASTAKYDSNGRRIKSSTSTASLQTSPTKIANPLLEQILAKMSHLRDDKQVVEKLQDLIRDYRGNADDAANDVDNASNVDNGVDPNLEFTRAWVDGNGTVLLPRNEAQSVASPRKDPKPASERGSGFSRIPAPVYKRPMSVASDSL